MPVLIDSNKTLKSAFYGSNKLSSIWYGANKVYSAVEKFVTFKSANGNAFDLYHYGAESKTNDGDLQYSLDKVNWTSWNYTSSQMSSVVYSNSNNEIYVRQVGGTQLCRNFYIDENSTGNQLINVSGDIRTLIDCNNYASVQPKKYMFARMFQQLKIEDARNLIMPFTTIEECMYYYMFNNCTSLKYAPKSIPATLIKNQACYSMFRNCTQLEIAPQMRECDFNGAYNMREMFYGCRELILPPQGLSIESLSGQDAIFYTAYRMFYGCTKLTKVVPINITMLTYNGLNASNAFYEMYRACTSLTQINKLLPLALTYNCYNSMYNGCSTLKVYSSATGTSTKEYRIPYSGTGTTGTSSLNNMFSGTGGNVTTPTINTTYYIDDSIEIV